MSNHASSTSTKTIVGTTLAMKKTINETHTLRFEIDDFENLPSGPDDCVATPCLDCHGYQWQLRVYPGQVDESVFNEDDGDNEDQRYVLITLNLFDALGPGDRRSVLFTDYGIRIGDKVRSGRQPFTIDIGFGRRFLRTELLGTPGCLKNGSLVVEVDITILEEKKKPLWSPTFDRKKENLPQPIKANDENGRFRVGGKMYPAYLRVLQTQAPTLHELLQGAANDEEVEVSDVTCSTFECFLRFVYDRELPSSELIESDGRALLEAADRFGCKQLKLYVESEIAKSFVNSNNAADWVLFADSHSCALLKETAMNVFASDATAVMASDGWAAVKESRELLLELMEALAHRGKKRCACWGEEIDYTNKDAYFEDMDISTLRQKLEERGDYDALDGTREMLLKRLKA